LGPAHKMKLRKEAIQYASTMANISINDGISPHKKSFGIPSPITPEHCVDFGRIGYVILQIRHKGIILLELLTLYVFQLHIPMVLQK
jgi:hypothetical protein